jgi:hypothetical protein
MKRYFGSSWIELGFVVLWASLCSAQLGHRGIVRDATTKHVVVAGGLTSINLAAAERDPRVMMQLQRRQRRNDERSLN